MWYWPTYAIWAVRRNHVAFVWSTTYIWMRRVTFRRNDNDQFKVDLWSLFHHECGELLLLSVSKSNLITSSGIPKSPLNVLLVRLYATDSTSLTSCPWLYAPDSPSLIVSSISFENRTCISKRHFIISSVCWNITADKIWSGSWRIHLIGLSASSKVC